MMSALGKCTACDEDALADAKGEPHIHPKLGVLLCERCYGRDTRVFEVDVRNPLCSLPPFDHLSLPANVVPVAPLHAPCTIAAAAASHLLPLLQLGQDDGYEVQCRWCGVGGDLVGCGRCVSSYCESCIEHNLGKKHLEQVKQTDDWCCYSCDPTPTLSLRWDNKKSGKQGAPRCVPLV